MRHFNFHLIAMKALTQLNKITHLTLTHGDFIHCDLIPRKSGHLGEQVVNAIKRNCLE